MDGDFMKVIVLDTETTDIRNGSICQLTYLMMDFDTHKYDAKNFFFAVDEVSPGAEAVHGLSVDKLKILSNGIRFHHKYSEINEDLSSADVVIGHNIHFDLQQLRNEYFRIGKGLQVRHSFCTMGFYTDICKIENPVSKYKNTYKWPKLEEVVKFCNLDNINTEELCYKFFKTHVGFHDARYDVACTFAILREAMAKHGLDCNKVMSSI